MDESIVPVLAQCSISWRNYVELLGKLEIRALDLREPVLPPFSTHDLRPLLLERGIYPARDFPELITRRLPDLFVTYDWRENILAVGKTIWLALDYCANNRGSKYANADTDLLMQDGVTFWLDWVFLDQSSRNVDRELDEILPALFNDGSLHLVASATALSRAWCCYELAQFNRHAAEYPGASLSSLIPEDLQEFPLWGGVVSTDPDDKLKVEKRVIDLFPRGLPGLEHLMVQAGLIAETRAMSSATLEKIRTCFGRWLDRFEGAR